MVAFSATLISLTSNTPKQSIKPANDAKLETRRVPNERPNLSSEQAISSLDVSLRGVASDSQNDVVVLLAGGRPRRRRRVRRGYNSRLPTTALVPRSAVAVSSTVVVKVTRLTTTRIERRREEIARDGG